MNIGEYPPLVQTALAKMSDTEKLTFETEYAKQKKSPGLYVALAILFPIHLALLGKWGLQILFTCTFGGVLVWWIIEWFRVSKRVQEYNEEKALEIARYLKIMS